MAKLTNVMGDAAGRELMREILLEIGMDELRSASDLRCFANALGSRKGFAAAVGGILSLHVTMYERH
ncbi:MAG TPA: hypothetical protein VHN14_06790 [Kofleriaceae bacterium]|nr:hypothetical protein [Kofleriaceae bacterium]